MQFRRHKKRKEATEKTKSYRFWHGGEEYICNVTCPVEIPDYRIKEAFDKTFVGKKVNSIGLLSSYVCFKALSSSATYTVQRVKEIANV